MRKLLLIVLLFQCSSLLAQPFIEIASIQYGQVGISDLYKGKDEWRIKNDWLNAAINLPLKVGKRDYLLISPEYNKKHFYDVVSNHINGNNGNVSVEGTAKYESTYHSMALPITYLHTLNDTSKNLVFFYIYRQNYSDILKPG